MPKRAGLITQHIEVVCGSPRCKCRFMAEVNKTSASKTLRRAKWEYTSSKYGWRCPTCMAESRRPLLEERAKKEQSFVEVVRLRVEEGFTWEEVASRCGLSAAYLRKNQSRVFCVGLACMPKEQRANIDKIQKRKWAAQHCKAIARGRCMEPGCQSKAAFMLRCTYFGVKQYDAVCADHVFCALFPRVDASRRVGFVSGYGWDGSAPKPSHPYGKSSASNFGQMWESEFQIGYELSSTLRDGFVWEVNGSLDERRQVRRPWKVRRRKKGK